MQNSVKILSVLFLFLFAASVVVPSAYAKGGHKHSLEHKFNMKVKFILLHQDELNMSDEQVEVIKKIKMDLKKSMIRQKAEIEGIMVDFYSALHQDPIDIEAINALIDQKYEVKKIKMRGIVEAITNIKGNMSSEQRAQFKDMWMDYKKKRCFG